MSVLWTKGVETGRLTPNEFVAVTSTNIAKILNVYPRKGAIVEGADADIVVWDPKLSKTVSAASQKSIIDYNVFEGLKVTGLPRYTLSRGDVVWADGQEQPAAAGAGEVRAEAGVPGAAQGAGGLEGADEPAQGRARSDEHPVRGLRWDSPRRTPRRLAAAAAAASGYRRGAAEAPVCAALGYREALAALRRAGAGARLAGGRGGRASWCAGPKAGSPAW